MDNLAGCRSCLGNQDDFATLRFFSMAYIHPNDLMAGLTNGDGCARTELENLCREDLAKCETKWRSGRSFRSPREAMLHWLEMFLVSRSPAVLARLSVEPDRAWIEFRSYALVVVCRWLLWPEPVDEGRRSAESQSDEFHSRFFWRFDEASLPTIVGQPSHAGYELAIYQRPKDELSGDVVQAVTGDGEVWLLVADGCGKGVAVHLVVHGISLLWRQALRDAVPEPEAVLRELQVKLSPHIPEAFFVEAALVRLDRFGRVTLTAAGGVVAVHRAQRAAEATCHELGGCMLGDVGYPEMKFETNEWTLATGQEILFSTDGFYDQMTGEGRVRSRMASFLAGCTEAVTLFDAALGNVAAALHKNDQDDDISIASLRAF